MRRKFPFRRIVPAICGLVILAGAAKAAETAETGLQLEAKIMLGQVRGRIDHMAVDLGRQRLFVAELGNDSIGIVDLANRNLVRTIGGLSEPQGVGYEPLTDTLFVANARDGSVRFFEGDNYKPAGRIELGSDADNVRVDAATKRVVIGHGDGGLAFLDSSSRVKNQNVPLKAHPESFQIEPDADRIFVNLPDAHVVAVIDGKAGKQIANWKMEKSGNFAMAIDRDRSSLLVAFRNPPELAAFALADGKNVSSAETCSDIDDLFVDRKRARIYASCGAGYVDIFEATGGAYRRIARIPTAEGARTSLFVPEMDRLLVAARAGPAGPAAIWVFRPTP